MVDDAGHHFISRYLRDWLGHLTAYVSRLPIYVDDNGEKSGQRSSPHIDSRYCR